MSERALVVLADGIQAAFCAGVVAELASRGCRWQEGAGAGLGAQVALLGVAGEAEEAAQRFFRMKDEGASLFRPAVACLRDSVSDPSFLLLPDLYRLAGWLWQPALEEYLAPEAALVSKVTLWVAHEDLEAGSRGWRRLATAEELLQAAAFPWGWAPRDLGWGGVGACEELGLPPVTGAEVDLVCGFPVPPVPRPGLGQALMATVQRREELAAALTVTRWAAEHPGVRVFAPSQELYSAFTQREGALLGVEYPLPVEHNGELMATMVGFGRFVATQKGG